MSVALSTNGWCLCLVGWLVGQATEVAIEDIKRVYNLFVDLKRSEEYLRAYQDEYMFNDQSADKMVE